MSLSLRKNKVLKCIICEVPASDRPSRKPVALFYCVAYFCVQFMVYVSTVSTKSFECGQHPDLRVPSAVLETGAVSKNRLFAYLDNLIFKHTRKETG